MDSTKFNMLISNIEKAYDGASLRLALIEALEEINNDGGNALTFGGYYPNYFAFKSDFDYELSFMSNTLNNFNDYPTRGSTALIQSGNTMDYLSTLLLRLNKLNGGQAQTTVANTLKILSNTKGLIKDAIEFQGGTIEDLDSFEKYADRILELNVWNNIGEVTITENGERRAAEGEGWNVIHVNVQPKVEAKLITAVGDWEVPAGVDAWNPVTISVPGLPNRSSSTGSGGSSGGSGGSGGGSGNIEYAHIEASSNGTYTASEQQKEAIGSIDVKVNGIDPAALALMRFTVTFQLEDGTMLEQVPNVVGGTSVVYGAYTYEKESRTLPLPTKDSGVGTIYNFSHWDPMPIYVDHDMTCTAVFEDAIYSTQEAQDYDWEGVISGNQVPIGTWKVLNLKPWNGPDGTNFYPGPIRMMCVSKSEGGTTWVSMDTVSYDRIQRAVGWNDTRAFSLTPLNGYLVNEDGVKLGTEIESNNPAWGLTSKLGWLNSPLRIWLSYEFIKCFPPLLAQHIKAVNKSTHTIWNADPEDTTIKDAVDVIKQNVDLSKASWVNSISDGTTWNAADKIWIPSAREVWGSYSDRFGNIVIPSDESSGSDASDNRTLCFERQGASYDSYSNYMNIDVNLWDNNRAEALKQVFVQGIDTHMSIKHCAYYPYGQMIAASRPWGNQTQSFWTPWRPCQWPLRTSYSGSLLCFNEYGNSKADVRSAANEQIADPGCNIKLMSNASNQGICFGFVIG